MRYWTRREQTQSADDTIPCRAGESPLTIAQVRSIRPQKIFTSDDRRPASINRGDITFRFVSGATFGRSASPAITTLARQGGRHGNCGRHRFVRLVP